MNRHSSLSSPPATVAPFRPAAPHRPSNLPAQPTALIGREPDLITATTRLSAADVRLLTLTGPGGVGKTRLAFAVAARLLDTFEHGAFVVSRRDYIPGRPTWAPHLGTP